MRRDNGSPQPGRAAVQHAATDRPSGWMDEGSGAMAGQHAGVEMELRTAVAERLGEARFGLWFGEGVRLGIDGDALEVGVPNAFFREWIQGHFAGNLIEAAESVAGRSLRLSFRVDDEAEPRV